MQLRPLLAAPFLALALGAQAAPPSTESLEALLAATRAEAMVDAMMANVENTMRIAIRQGTAGKELTPEQQKVFDDTARRFADVVHDELSWAKLKPAYLQIYQETFTQEEVDGALAFYRSPAGQAMVEKLPQVVQRSATMMQARMKPMMARLRAAVEQAKAEAGVQH